ncbi:histidine--tRNA ligase [Nonlabens sp. Ci31]|jgi:histidyl-tRNA synthetase|uniref:histidine--tRNA ligase n=1 Tax=Nonlabens sp. Ci31 TaxID=2608253 RepID=UPI0014646285|nr:histidine--tRNA ligase [Nonlabens sp. Ci31]QJP35174.1 histidine--tRNA ligase [Nonlabens sp. Ci31]
MAQKPSIPKGTRDFSPLEVQRRQYIMNKIQRHFELYGFMPIETPSFENSDTLMGKYGEEGDRLIFKILNSGEYLKKADPELLETGKENQLTAQISDKALRYDLTVPFARYVVQNQNDITFPFKRYQMQNVWRADRPQKGRFREFTQCDADVVGSNSLFQEVELVQLYDTVFTDLKLKACTIKINNRKVLAGIAEVMGAEDKLIDFTVALDKLDKIGKEKVQEEMLSKGINQQAIDILDPVFSLSGSYAEKIASMKELLKNSEIGLKGIEELEFINTSITQMPLKSAVLDLDITLARGLNYYTGCIFEVAAPEGVAMGSVGGGGRYDDLTGIFGLKDVSGVGISFGLDRIYLVLEQLDLFPDSVRAGVEVLFINFGMKEAQYCSLWLSRFRESGIKTELYPDAAKMKKQMSYADRNAIPYVILAGEDEITTGKLNLKNMASGEQSLLTPEEIISKLS